MKGTLQTVLVVDDNPAVRKVVAAVLHSRGFRTMEAQNGLEAVQVFGFHHSDIALVISDIDMPVMDGPEAVSRMLDIDASVPMLFITGRLMESAGRLGDFPCLPKPFTPAQLVECIRSVLGVERA